MALTVLAVAGLPLGRASVLTRVEIEVLGGTSSLRIVVRTSVKERLRDGPEASAEVRSFELPREELGLHVRGAATCALARIEEELASLSLFKRLPSGCLPFVSDSKLEDLHLGDKKGLDDAAKQAARLLLGLVLIPIVTVEAETIELAPIWLGAKKSDHPSARHGGAVALPSAKFPLHRRIGGTTLEGESIEDVFVIEFYRQLARDAFLSHDDTPREWQKRVRELLGRTLHGEWLPRRRLPGLHVVPIFWRLYPKEFRDAARPMVDAALLWCLDHEQSFLASARERCEHSPALPCNTPAHGFARVQSVARGCGAKVWERFPILGHPRIEAGWRNDSASWSTLVDLLPALIAAVDGRRHKKLITRALLGALWLLEIHNLEKSWPSLDAETVVDYHQRKHGVKASAALVESARTALRSIQPRALKADVLALLYLDYVHVGPGYHPGKPFALAEMLSVYRFSREEAAFKRWEIVAVADRYERALRLESAGMAEPDDLIRALLGWFRRSAAPGFLESELLDPARARHASAHRTMDEAGLAKLVAGRDLLALDAAELFELASRLGMSSKISSYEYRARPHVDLVGDLDRVPGGESGQAV